jgi:chloramphenicol O-acetyltransferase type B
VTTTVQLPAEVWRRLGRLFPSLSASARNQRLVAAGVLSVGRRTYGSPRIPSWAPGDWPPGLHVSIGSFCSIGDGVVIYPGGNHRTDWVTTFPLRIKYGLPGAWEDGCPTSAGPVRIGNDVWIADHVTVLSGVTVGDGAVLGAHSLVTHDVDPYAIVGGNPARLLRRRFTDEQVESLLEIRWWEWSDERIVEAVPLLCGDDVDEFIRWAKDGGR